MIKTRVTPDEIKKRYMDGESLNDIADTENLSGERLRQILLRSGMRVQDLKQERDDNLRDRILKLARKGQGAQQIANTFGHSLNWAYWVCRKFNIRLKTGEMRGRRKAEHFQVVKDLYVKGLTHQEIAQRMGVSKFAVNRWITDSGSADEWRQEKYQRRWQAASHMHNQGLSVNEIASEMQCSAQTIYKALRDRKEFGPKEVS